MSIYLLKDGLYEPQTFATSAWNPSLQSGIVLAGLLTHTIEQTPAPGAMMLARLTMDIVRPAPMKPLEVSSRVVREGRRMQTLEATARIEGAVVARATALRLRNAETPPAAPPSDRYISPEEAPLRSLGRMDANPSAMETRVIRGGRHELGPGLVWGRPGYELTPGVRLSPTAGAAMMADLGSGVSNELDPDHWSYASVDLSVHFARAPRSDWILVDARTTTLGNGVGLVDTVLADREGPFGRAHQTLFIAPQERAA